MVFARSSATRARAGHRTIGRLDQLPVRDVHCPDQAALGERLAEHGRSAIASVDQDSADAQAGITHTVDLGQRDLMLGETGKAPLQEPLQGPFPLHNWFSSREAVMAASGATGRSMLAMRMTGSGSPAAERECRIVGLSRRSQLPIRMTVYGESRPSSLATHPPSIDQRWSGCRLHVPAKNGVICASVLTALRRKQHDRNGLVFPEDRLRCDIRLSGSRFHKRHFHATLPP